MLVRYNPDVDAAARERQLATLRALSDALQGAGRDLMFELIVPPLAGQLAAAGGERDDYDRTLRAELTVRGCARSPRRVW